MTCVHFRPNVPATGKLGLAVSSSRIDVCELLLATDPKNEEYRAGLLEKGLKLAHAFACPVASGGRWKVCPYYDKPERRRHRGR